MMKGEGQVVMEKILAILVEMWVSDDWRESRVFIIVFGTIVFAALLVSMIGMGFVI